MNRRSFIKMVGGVFAAANYPFGFGSAVFNEPVYRIPYRKHFDTVFPQLYIERLPVLRDVVEKVCYSADEDAWRKMFKI